MAAFDTPVTPSQEASAHADAQTLRVSELLLWRLIESNIVGVFFRDSEDRVIEANDAFLQLVGLERATLRAAPPPWMSLLRPTPVGGAEPLRSTGEGRAPVAADLIRPDGTTVPVLIASVYLEGASYGAVGVVLDLTVRRQAEQLRRQADLLDLAHDAIVVRDLQSAILFWNRGAEETYGYTRDEAVGRATHELLQTRFETSLEEIERALRRDGRWEGELIHHHRDGRTMIVASRQALQSDEHGNPAAILEINRDVTDRKRAEAEVRDLNEILRRRASDLEMINRELEAFSYSVSHDLRAPLRAIDGFSQALLEDYSGDLDEAGRDYLNRVRAASQRMAQLIDDLLNLSRVTRAELHWAPVDLSALARAIIEDLQRAHPERSVEFVLQEGLQTRGDARLLEVALQNLLRNAWKYTGRRAHARIEFGARNDDGTPVFYVRDDGAGFDMRYVDKLFGPFQRLHAMTDFPGTGIGLALVQRVIHRHCGRVWAEGAVEQGAAFYFTVEEAEGKGER